MGAKICPMYTRLCNQSSITKANDMFHNLLRNTGKNLLDVCCVQAPAVAPSGSKQQLNRITICVFCQQVTRAQTLGGLQRDGKYILI